MTRIPVVDGDARGRASRVPAFSVTFLVGIVVGMLATFATLNGRLVTVEVEVSALSETLRGLQAEQRTQNAALEQLTEQLISERAADDARGRKRP